MTSEKQIEKLADFILKEVDREPSENEGAVDTAIRIIREGMREDRRLLELAGEDEMAEEGRRDPHQGCLDIEWAHTFERVHVDRNSLILACSRCGGVRVLELAGEESGKIPLTDVPGFEETDEDYPRWGAEGMREKAELLFSFSGWAERTLALLEETTTGLVVNGAWRDHVSQARLLIQEAQETLE